MSKDIIEGVIYDENGQRTFTSNVDVLTIQMKDKLLINSYRNTRYQKALFLEAIRLHQKGVKFQVMGFEYEPELINNSLDSMRVEILDRFGGDYAKELEDKIINEDLAFLKERPDELN